MATPLTHLPLTPASIAIAHEKIKPYVHRTPFITNKTLNLIASSPDPAAHLSGNNIHDNTPEEHHHPPRLRIHLKLENTQRTGSFKARGAFHAVLSLLESQSPSQSQSPTHPSSSPHGPTLAIATQSSGNHAQALALAASTFGIPAYIVMPRVTSANKVAATKGYGADVVFCDGHTVRDREQGLREVVERLGREGVVVSVVPPYDDERVILGQGTCGREVEEQFREGYSSGGLDVVVAPVSGGGLLGGIATWFGDQDGTKVFGAEPSFEGANDVERGLKQGKRVEAVNSLTVAEGCRGVVGLRNWGIISDMTKVEGVYGVTEEEILMATRLLFERVKTVVEPSGAVALAMVLFNPEWRRWAAAQQGGGEVWDVAVVLSGGNTTMEAIAKLYGR